MIWRISLLTAELFSANYCNATQIEPRNGDGEMTRINLATIAEIMIHLVGGAALALVAYAMIFHH